MAEPKTTALYNLPDILAGDELSDVIVEVNSRRYNLHRVILASCSDFFRAMFTGKMKESTDDVITLAYDSLTTEAFEIMVDFAYKSQLKLTRDNVFEVFMAADHLQMLSAMAMCAEYLLNLVDDMTIQVSHLLTIAEFLSKYDLPEVKEKVTKCMAAKFENLADTKEFSEAFSREKLAGLLERDDLVAGSEADVLQIVVKWVEADEDNRIEYLEDLISRVRLPLIEPSKLTELMDTERLRKQPCYHLYVKTLKFHTHSTAICNLNNTPRNSTRVFAKVTSLQSKYVVSYRKDNEWNDIVTRRSSHVPDFEYVQTTVVDNTLFIVHGSGAMYKFDPPRRGLTQLRPMKEIRKGFPLLYDGGEFLYALGGETEDEDDIRAAERYSLHTGKWQRIASLPESGGRHAAATVFKDRVVYMCNQNVYSFDAEHNTWEKMTTYDAAFNQPVFAAVIEGRLHLFKTRNGTVQIYSDDEAWEHVNQRGVPDRWKSRAFRGVDGQVYVIGGTECYATGIYVDPDDPYEVDIDDWKWMMETAEKSNIIKICVKHR
ncbi:kelch-like protein 26 [Ptychodera flava]|uniref:kelch-like protein 26 n=1 Tax=Ptychodera flava TaxID=63121 RepID=UPI00396A19DD